MPTEILYQGAGFTIARTDMSETLVPYGPAPRPTGALNYGWIDLRDRPECVADIPEAARSEGLSKLLRVIADPVSQIMSIGSDCHAFERSTAESHGPRWYVGGYVAVTFKDAERNLDPNNLVEMARYILSGIGVSSEHHIKFEMIVEPLKSFFGRLNCHCLSIKPFGYGSDEPQAWAAFEWATSAVADAIQKGVKQGRTSDQHRRDNMKAQPGPPMTLRSAATAQVRLIVWCKSCQHQVEPDPAEMAARYGADTSVLDWRERIVCSKCGGRQVDMVVTGTKR